jgi:hypothetical protein
MNNIREIVKDIGREALCDELGCGSTAISNAITRGTFPPSWRKIISGLAKKKGVEISDDLFNWRQPQPKGE